MPGALPVLAGWIAAGGGLGPDAVALFAILFLWQLPHFLALGWLHRNDYRRAGFAVANVGARARRLFLASVVYLPLLLLVMVADKAV